MRADIQRAFSTEDSPLRRAQPLAVELPADEPAPAAPAPTFTPKVERRKAERRGMDALRDEALRKVISKVEDRNFGGLRNRVNWGRHMSPSRIVLVAVALIAGGLAAVMATQVDRPEPPAPELVTEIVPAATAKVLVAKDAIAVGQRLATASLEWVDWPESALRTEFITNSVRPEAATEMAGTVARYEFFPGEPIREQKLAQPGGGYLATVLETGKRGVSVSVAAASASGGFIVPNDRVDVVSTRITDEGQVSETILRNVRVLAINGRLGEVNPGGSDADAANPIEEVFSNEAVATLELDSVQAELIVNATVLGQLTLVLRSTTDAAEAGNAEQRAANQAIRISSPFWAR